MQPNGLDTLLDDGDGALLRVLAGFAMAVGLALLLAVAVPLALFSRVPTANPHAGPPHANISAQSVGGAHPPHAVHEAVEVARRYLGVPYVFGGTDPRTGLDCSGLVLVVFRQLGIGLPRTAQQQYDATQRIERDQLQPGDLVFFARTYADPHAWITHVGIYIGDGMQLNAPTTGQVVSIQPAFSGFWGAHYAGAGRVRGATASTTNGGSHHE